MRTPGYRKLCSIPLALLLASAAIPVFTQEAAAIERGFELGLGEALDRELAAPEAESYDIAAVREAAPEADAPRIRLASLQEASWQRFEQQEQATQPAPPPPQRRGFGRWLKRHWWVPVLVGAAIGVAVSDDGSDSPDDPEDDD